MSQLFHKSANSISKASIVLGALLVGGTLGAVMIVDRSGYNTRTGTTIPQPIPFSHEHHVSGLGIDCRYCHTAVEKSSSAGLPPTATCYNCHKLIWNDSPMLEPVRESFRTNVPIRWNRVHDLPGFVQFNHSIHVAKGVGCASCHGAVGKMALLKQEKTLQMGWCLDCHRNPEKNLRPKEEVFNMEFKAADQLAQGKKLKEDYHIRSEWALTSCSTCHY